VADRQFQAIICRHETLAQISGDERHQDGGGRQHRAGQSLARQCEPHVWRRVRVLGSMTLRELHGVVQVIPSAFPRLRLAHYKIT